MKNINIFIHGINGGEEDLEICVQKLSQFEKFARFPEYINLDHIFFNEEEKSYLFCEEEKKALDSQMRELIAFAENKEDQILVILRTGDEDGFDLLENQVYKLEYFMQYFEEEMSKYAINLIGHSQGGVVALRYAIKYPDKVQKIITISAPLNSNYIAKNLLLFYRLMKKASFMTQFLESASVALRRGKDVNRLIEVSKTLASDTYFNKLKTDWRDLKIKPKLYIIAGGSGIIRKNFLISKRGTFFDGLVSLDEQIDFICDQCEVFIRNPYCMIGCENCKKSCDVPTINLNQILKEEVSNFSFVHKKNHFLETTKALMTDICDSLNGKEVQNEEIHEIFNNQFAHDYLKNQDFVIELIHTFLGGNE